jgi:hypothetical protein
MMTPDPQKDVLQEMRQMLARAKPEQTKKLLADIMNAAPAVRDTVKYDA